MLEYQYIKPAPGAGRMTPEQLLSPAWRHFGERVLLGAGFLDMEAGTHPHSAQWRRTIQENMSRLDMGSGTSCLLAILYGSWRAGCHEFGLFPHASFGEDPRASRLGFTTCRSCDPAALAYMQDPENLEYGAAISTPIQGLTSAWTMYITATADLF